MTTHIATSTIELAKQSVIAYNEKNWEAVKESLTSDAVYDEVATARRLEGQGAILAVWKEWAAVFPDSRATFERAVASDDIVALEIRWRGTHKGPLNAPTGKIEPTGRSIDLRACQIIELSGSKTKSIRHYFDMATLLRQLGTNT